MHAAISETAVLAAAQSFITLGLREAGYEYVNIDVCLSPITLCDYPYHTSGLLVSVRSRPRYERIDSRPIEVSPRHQKLLPLISTLWV